MKLSEYYNICFLVVEHGSYSSSSSSVENKRGSGEQEQVVIARFLASMQPSELKNLKQSDFQWRQDKCPCKQRLDPSTPGLYPIQCQNWVYPGLQSLFCILQEVYRELWFPWNGHIPDVATRTTAAVAKPSIDASSSTGTSSWFSNSSMCSVHTAPWLSPICSCGRASDL